MTIGIYKLIFNNTSKCYIGQSNDIEKRFNSHIYAMKKSISSRKLNNAYTTFGIPTLEILVQCTSQDLAANELKFIELYNSISDGFNTIGYANGITTLQGPEHGSAIYTKEQILEVFNMLLDTSATYKEVAEVLNVSFNVVTQIAESRSHTWLASEFPMEYSLLKNNRNIRSKLIGSDSDKRSSKSIGLIHPKVVSPDGTIYSIDNVRAFCRNHNIHNANFTAVLKGTRKSTGGWRVAI